MISEGVRNHIMKIAGKRHKGLLAQKEMAERYFQYLEDLIDASSKVDKRYYTINDYSNFDPEEIERYYERMYAYELYHQLRLIIGERDKEIERYKNVILNGEMQKSFYLYKYLTLGKNNSNKTQALEVSPELSRLIDKCFGPKDRLIPDLILHEKDSVDEQVYLVEIKMGNNPNYLEDFEKLTNFKICLEKFVKESKGKHNPSFHLYIFLYEDDLEKKMECSSKIQSIKKDIDGSIICCYRKNNERYCCRTFDELMEIVNKRKSKKS